MQQKCLVLATIEVWILCAEASRRSWEPSQHPKTGFGRNERHEQLDSPPPRLESAATGTNVSAILVEVVRCSCELERCRESFETSSDENGLHYKAGTLNHTLVGADIWHRNCPIKDQIVDRFRAHRCRAGHIL